MCGGVDTGYDEEPRKKYFSDSTHIVLVNMDFCHLEMITLAHVAEKIRGAFGVSMAEFERALIDVAVAFQPPREDLYDGLFEQLKMLEIGLLPRDDWPLIIQDDVQPPVRPSRIRPKRLPISYPPPIRRRMMDSRSGLKGRTTRRKMGK